VFLRISFWRVAFLVIFSSLQNQKLFSLLLSILHSALHGRSASIASKVSFLKTSLSFLASFLITFVFVTDCLESVNLSFSIRIALLSFANISHEFSKYSAI
jgi:hypothetical protein